MKFEAKGPFTETDKPEKTGNSEVSKKRGKKSTRVPLGNTINTSEKSDRKERRAPLFPELVVSEPVAEASEKAKDTKNEKVQEPLVLPEVDVQPADEFKGELVIEHEEITETKEKELAGDMGTSPNETSETTTQSTETENSDAVEGPQLAEQALSEAEADNQTAELAPDSSESPDDNREALSPPRVAPPLLFGFEAGRQRAQASVEENMLADTNTPARAPLSPESPTMFDPSLRSIERALYVPYAKTEEVMPVAEAKRKARRAEQRGLSRGVVSGGLVGWLIGRRGKRAIERETAHVLENRDKQLEQLVKERDTQAETAKQRLSVIERTQEELRKMMQKTWDKEILKRRHPQSEVTSVPVSSEANSQSRVPESLAPVFETIRFTTVENLKSTEKHQPAHIENLPLTEELYKTPEGRRVELSAWHRIEVDEKTGKVAESPSVAYGEAFNREQKQEKLARDAAQAQSAASVGTTVLQGFSSSTSSDPVAPVSRASFQSRQSIRQIWSDNADFVTHQLKTQTTSPVTWGIAFVVVVLLFLSGLL